MLAEVVERALDDSLEPLPLYKLENTKSGLSTKEKGKGGRSVNTGDAGAAQEDGISDPGGLVGRNNTRSGSSGGRVSTIDSGSLVWFGMCVLPCL